MVAEAGVSLGAASVRSARPESPACGGVRLTEATVRFGQGDTPVLNEVVPQALLDLARQDEQRSVPRIAKNRELTRIMEHVVRTLPSTHKLILGDSRQMDAISDESVHLIVTSPPYWT